jgi:hypothetical protein
MTRPEITMAKLLAFYPIKLGSPVIVFRFSEYTCIVEFRAEPHAARLARIATCIAVNAG